MIFLILILDIAFVVVYYEIGPCENECLFNLVWNNVGVLLAQSHSAKGLLVPIFRQHDVVPVVRTEGKETSPIQEQL